MGQHETIQILQGSRDYLAGSIPLMWWGNVYLNRTWLGIWGRQNKWFINYESERLTWGVPQKHLKRLVPGFLSQP